jgi:hypothetical protein
MCIPPRIGVAASIDQDALDTWAFGEGPGGVLLACAPEEQHSLPLHALAAGLTELRVPVRLLGGRVPTSALPTAVRRTGAGALFLWRHFDDAATDHSDELAGLAELPPSRPALRVVVGGLGWQQAALPAGARYAQDLETAVRLLR